MPASCANAFSPTIALFGCGPNVMVSRQQLAGGVNVLGDDLGLKRQPVAARLERHHDLFERRVARAFADAVDGALDLPRAGLHRGDGIRHRESQIVVAMHADDRAVAQRPHHAADQCAVFFRHRIADRVRQIHRPRARPRPPRARPAPGNPNPCAWRLRRKTPRHRYSWRASSTAATASSSTCCCDFFSLYFR